MRISSVFAIISFVATLSAALPVPGSPEPSLSHESLTPTAKLGEGEVAVAKIGDNKAVINSGYNHAPKDESHTSHPQLRRRDHHDDAIREHTEAKNTLQAQHQALVDSHAEANRVDGRAQTAAKNGGAAERQAATAARADKNMKNHILRENEHMTSHHQNMIDYHTHSQAAEGHEKKLENSLYPESIQHGADARASRDQAHTHLQQADYSRAMARTSRSAIENP
ncbi:hypothetical protein FRC16_006408 [Serendipita sp. 398]|nr:hypothetical protein FRC16_006408 [Serendipita sp. 398]